MIGQTGPALLRVVEVAERAGSVIERFRGRSLDVEIKPGQGPVTAADRAANALLQAELLALEPCGWLSEETADDRARLSEARTWVVDPLDGTKEFVRGRPEYTVAVALVEDGRPILAVVHNPATGETFSAERGQGAQRQNRSLAVRESQIVLGSRTEIRRGEFGPFAARWDVRGVGSIQYKLALVASGEAAATWSRGPKWEWDVCAGSLLVEEAGGKVTDLYSSPLRFNKRVPKVAGVLAGAPVSYDRARPEIERVGPDGRMDAEFLGKE